MWVCIMLLSRFMLGARAFCPVARKVAWSHGRRFTTPPRATVDNLNLEGLIDDGDDLISKFDQIMVGMEAKEDVSTEETGGREVDEDGRVAIASCPEVSAKLVAALEARGITHFTDIQSQALAPALGGRDILARSRTGASAC